MGCGSSTAAAAPAAQPPAAAGAEQQKEQAHSPFQYGGAAASEDSGGGGAANSAPAWQDEEASVRVSGVADEIVDGQATVLGGAAAENAPVASGAGRATSHLDSVQDETTDVNALSDVVAPGAGADTAAGSAPATEPGGVQVGGTWGAVDKLHGTKLTFSTEEVEALNSKFKSKMDADASGSLDLVEFQQQLSELANVSPLLARRLFTVFDKDGSGTIEWQEFMAGLSGCCSSSPEEKMALCFKLYDLDGDGFLVPAELEAMLSAYIIGSAKLAAEACDVMELEELDLDAEFDEDNWDDVQSLLPSGSNSVALLPEQEVALQQTITEFTAEIMTADANKDGKLSKEEFLSWANGESGGDSGALAANQQLLTKWMDLFAGSLSGGAGAAAS